MSDRFSGHAAGLTAPVTGGAAIVPNDDLDLPVPTRGLNVAESGSVRVITIAGDDITLYITAGSLLPIRVRRVMDTDTDAAGIVGLW